VRFNGLKYPFPKFDYDCQTRNKNSDYIQEYRPLISKKVASRVDRNSDKINFGGNPV
jgi:hypothetical protein